MTDYEIRFRQLLTKTAIGFGIGFIVSLFLVIPSHYTLLESIGCIFFYTLFIGLVASVILSAKSVLLTSTGNIITTIINGILRACFTVPSGSGFFFALSIIKAVIGVFLLVPILIYLVVSYPAKLIYLGIMTVRERTGAFECPMPEYSSEEEPAEQSAVETVE